MTTLSVVDGSYTNLLYFFHQCSQDRIRTCIVYVFTQHYSHSLVNERIPFRHLTIFYFFLVKAPDNSSPINTTQSITITSFIFYFLVVRTGLEPATRVIPYLTFCYYLSDRLFGYVYPIPPPDYKTDSLTPRLYFAAYQAVPLCCALCSVGCL